MRDIALLSMILDVAHMDASRIRQSQKSLPAPTNLGPVAATVEAVKAPDLNLATVGGPIGAACC